MHDIVHVDEKWFFVTQIKRRYYVYDDEEVAARSVQSKSHITKVMFLAAVARPRYDAHRRCLFDGKIGVWPFVTREAAKRSSKNRARGTIETKPLNVTADVYQDFLVNKVLPALVAKIPKGQLKRGMKIQQDNASPHRTATTQVLQAHPSWSKFKIAMANQPPNSPDFNILDLGFFNAIQSLQHKQSTRSIDELISAVENAFVEMPHETLSKTFLTLQKVMEESIAIGGCNNYKLPHMHKDKTIKDLTAFNLECKMESYERALATLAARIEQETRLEELIGQDNCQNE